MKISIKKLQEKCQKDAQNTANELNEPIVYQFFENRFYTESKYRESLAKYKESQGKVYTDEDWERDKKWDILEWYYPENTDEMFKSAEKNINVMLRDI